MTRRNFCFSILCTAAAFLAYSSISYAQGTATPPPPPATPPTTLPITDSSVGGGAPFSGGYTISDPNAFGAAGEGVNLQAVDPITEFTPPTDTDGSEYLQGCGGVGQAEYTTGVFNMPEVFNKFRRDVNTDLAKQLLTYNYSLPQTAALFETLNTYGNQRYQQFIQGCNLDDLKKDARKQYLDKCIKEVGVSNGTGSTGTITATPGEQYARAWEICTAMYAAEGQTDRTSVEEATTQRTEVNKKFAELMRQTENVNKYITPLMCPAETDTTTVGTPGTPNPPTATTTCWTMLFLPQVSICNGKEFDQGCGDGQQYGIKPALLPMRTFFDLLRTILSQKLITDVVNDLNIQIAKENISYSLQQYAATQAVNTLRQQANAAGTASGTGTTPTPSATPPAAAPTPPEAAFKDFQLNYLNCQNKDAVNNLKEYILQLRYSVTDLGAPPAGNTSNDPNDPTNLNNPPANLTLKPFTQAEITAVTTILGLASPLPNATPEDLPKLAEIVLGCTINQTIPMLDPIITAQLSTSCQAADRQAFYALASHDVALTSTKDVYRYLSTQLKQVRSRLETEPLKAASPATGTTGGVTPPATSTPADTPDSPELRRRLAAAITNVMLPAIDSQLERLNELEKTRGQFAKRVEMIYATKRGCVYQTGQGNLPTN